MQKNAVVQQADACECGIGRRRERARWSIGQDQGPYHSNSFCERRARNSRRCWWLDSSAAQFRICASVSCGACGGGEERRLGIDYLMSGLNLTPTRTDTLAVLTRADRGQPLSAASINSAAGASPKDPENAFASRPYRRCDELRIVRTHSTATSCATRVGRVGSARAAQQEERGRSAPRGVELWLRESAQPVAPPAP